jgi:HSP20 family protein
MAIERYRPTSLLEQFNNEINRMFTRDAAGFPALAGGQWAPAVDIRETEEAYFIEAEVPGVDPDGIEVTLGNGVLTLKGERRQSEEMGEGNARYRECSYGSFVRHFSMPETADEDSIEAKAENGVLKLKLDKKAKSKPRRIEVKA